MDEAVFINILKNISIFASVVGILTGLDLLSGARVISRLRKILDKVFNVDQKILKILSAIREKLDYGVYIDDVIIKSKSRIVLGVILLLFSILIILLIRTMR